MKGFERVEVYINTRDTGGEETTHNKEIIKEKPVNTPMMGGY